MLYQYRYFWSSSNDVPPSFCVITDTLEGHDLFIKRIVAEKKPINFSREYLCELDTSKLFVVDQLLNSASEVIKNEA